MKKIMCVITMLWSVNAFSWDGVVTGKITQIDVAPAENYGFRIKMEGNKKFCDNNHNWAYINKSNSNYEAYVGVLTTAKVAGLTVTVYSNRKNADANGYCSIGYIAVR